jgi:hypothetical protein
VLAWAKVWKRSIEQVYDGCRRMMGTTAREEERRVSEAREGKGVVIMAGRRLGSCVYESRRV